MCRYLKVILMMVVLATFVSFTGLPQAVADTLLFGVDLPTTNLNGYPIPLERSNRSPLGSEYTSEPTTYPIEGGSFLIGSPGEHYVVEKTSLYMVYGVKNTNGVNVTQYDQTPISPANFPSLSVWAGPAGNILQVPAAYMPYTVNRVWYNDGVNLQNWQRGLDGSWRGLWRIDFTPNVPIPINGGEKYYYFLDGLFQNASLKWQSPSLVGAIPSLGGITPVGTMQDYMLFFDTGTHQITEAMPGTNVYTNVAISGHLTPLPGTLLLLGSGLLGLVGSRRFWKR